jgi:hypothetical protein
VGDVGDIFNDTRAARADESKVRRAGNREKSAAVLAGAGVAFVSNNGGAHLVVEDRVDFWPGTGLWIVRKTLHRERGVFKLVKWLQRNPIDRGTP